MNDKIALKECIMKHYSTYLDKSLKLGEYQKKGMSNPKIFMTHVKVYDQEND